MTVGSAEPPADRDTATAAAGPPVTTVAHAPGHQFLRQSAGERAARLLWNIVWNTLVRWSPRPLQGWRRMLLRLFGARIHATARLAPSARVGFPWNLRVGERVRIEHGVILDCVGTIEIGAGTLVSQYAHLCAGTHDHQDRRMPIVRAPITVGRDCWIATDAFVGSGVTLGDGCLLAARSSAFDDLPPGYVCIGEPAEPRHKRFE